MTNLRQVLALNMKEKRSTLGLFQAKLAEIYDEAHSSLAEDRFITIGRFHDTVILFVVTVDKADGDTQIIMAREAVPKKQEAYYDHYRKNMNSGKN